MHISHPSVCVTFLIFCVYGRTIFYDLVIDDIDHYRNIRRCGFYPFILNPLLWLTQRFYGGTTFGINIFIEHCVTLSLHILTAVLMLHVSVVGAFLWVVHPCNHQTSIWLTGRRYSIINILFLVLLLTHTLYLIPLFAVPYALFIRDQFITRLSRQVPMGIYTVSSVFNTFRYSLWRLSGIPRYSFRYPYLNTAPYFPCSQPVAERYLSISLIILCLTVSTIPFIYVILPLYAFRTIQLIPMYRDIQSFYDYHRRLYPNLEKLIQIQRLYPSIIP